MTPEELHAIRARADANTRSLFTLEEMRTVLGALARAEAAQEHERAQWSELLCAGDARLDAQYDLAVAAEVRVADLERQVAGLKDVLGNMAQRLESHGNPDMPCRLDARDKNILARAAALLSERGEAS